MFVELEYYRYQSCLNFLKHFWQLCHLAGCKIVNGVFDNWQVNPCGPVHENLLTHVFRLFLLFTVLACAVLMERIFAGSQTWHIVLITTISFTSLNLTHYFVHQWDTADKPNEIENVYTCQCTHRIAHLVSLHHQSVHFTFHVCCRCSPLIPWHCLSYWWTRYSYWENLSLQFCTFEQRQLKLC